MLYRKLLYWNSETLECIHQFSGHTDGILSLEVSTISQITNIILSYHTSFYSGEFNYNELVHTIISLFLTSITAINVNIF